ncbi:MAG: helix-turn-helix domain-containing protein, partial [Ornithinimicrobium sp.]
NGYAAAPECINAHDLAHLITAAVVAVTYAAEPVAEGDVERVLRFGVQVDTRPVTARGRNDLDALEGGGLCAEQVAGYLAKYATKSATQDLDQTSNHRVQLRSVARDLAELADPTGPYALLGKWVHMLGFRGHFSSKSRRYSVTLGQLRRARQRFRSIVAQAERDGVPLDVADLEARLMADDVEDDTTLVISRWSYAGSGWDNDGDAALALAAANRAREYDQWKPPHERQLTRQGERTCEVMERLMLTVDEVAESLGIGKSAVYDLMRLRKLASVKIGRSRRVPVEALREYVIKATAASEGVAA